MGITPQHAVGAARAAVIAKSIAVGFVGGLMGNIAMGFFGAAIFLLLGFPVTLSFSIIGDAAAGFFSTLGIDVAGGIPLGAVSYCLIGLALGGILAATVWGVPALRVTTIRKGVGLSILFVEIMAVPMLALAIIVLQMSPSGAAQWFGISFVMHLVYGLVAGLVVGYGLRRIGAWEG
jgi:hypothetical protein